MRITSDEQGNIVTSNTTYNSCSDTESLNKLSIYIWWHSAALLLHSFLLSLNRLSTCMPQNLLSILYKLTIISIHHAYRLFFLKRQTIDAYNFWCAWLVALAMFSWLLCVSFWHLWCFVYGGSRKLTLNIKNSIC